jgi:hypothetical protein
MPADDTEPRWTTESYDPTDPANYPDHPEDVFDEPVDGFPPEAIPPDDPIDEDGPDVTDTQTGQGVD